MKKNKIIYILLAILIIIAAYYGYKNLGVPNTNKERAGALSDFDIKDTTSIDKIFIADAQGKQVTLTKVKNNWLVNGKYVARPDNIQLLMKTFSRIAIKAPVSNAAYNTVVKNIATGATKVEIYQGDNQPSKIYYIGGATLDHQGTYMLLEENGVKSTLPYITHIPGFYGYLTTRFFTNAQQWRDAVVFKYQPSQIKQITVQYFETPEESFIIEKNKDEFELKNFENKRIKEFNPLKVNDYVARYQKVYYEMIDEESSQEKIDSTVATQPYFSITITDNDNEINKIVAYHMPNFRTLLDNKGEEFKYDVDRMYGYLNDDLFTYIQFATFDNLRLPKTYFLK